MTEHQKYQNRKALLDKAYKAIGVEQRPLAKKVFLRVAITLEDMIYTLDELLESEHIERNPAAGIDALEAIKGIILFGISPRDMERKEFDEINKLIEHYRARLQKSQNR